MKCKDCEHFNILFKPFKIGKTVQDSGLAKCDKYDMVCDYISENQIDRLECVKGGSEMIKKFKLYKQAIIEIIETLCTICLVLGSEKGSSNRRHLLSHFSRLKEISEKFRSDNKHRRERGE